MIYDKKVIQQNTVKLGQTTKIIEYLKHSDRSCLIARNKAEKAKLIKRFNLSPDVSSRILVQENDTIKFLNGSSVCFVKKQKRGNCYKSWNTTVHLPI